jgi:hypothetical protein
LRRWGGVDSWVPVKVYQFNQGQYEFWTTLHGGYVAELGPNPLIGVD